MASAKTAGQIINPDAYYTEAEASALRRKSPRTLARERLSGTGCVYVRNGKGVLYRGSSILEWMQQRTFRSTSAESVAQPEA